MMTCREMTEFLADYFAEEIDVEVRREFEAHLAACPNCVMYLHQYREVIVATRECCGSDDHSDAPPLPDELVRAILDSARRLA